MTPLAAARFKEMFDAGRMTKLFRLEELGETGRTSELAESNLNSLAVAIRTMAGPVTGAISLREARRDQRLEVFWTMRIGSTVGRTATDNPQRTRLLWNSVACPCGSSTAEDFGAHRSAVGPGCLVLTASPAATGVSSAAVRPTARRRGTLPSTALGRRVLRRGARKLSRPARWRLRDPSQTRRSSNRSRYGPGSAR
jgi:hypothetical protein